MKDFFKDFFGGKSGIDVPTGRETRNMNKSFYEPEQPGTRPLSKSGFGPNPVDILDFHMRKASDSERMRKGQKKDEKE